MDIGEKVAFASVVIIPNVKKAGIREMVSRVGEWLRGHGATCSMLESDAKELGIEIRTLDKERLGEMELGVVLGGDGTMLHAVDLMRGLDTPLMGINIGKVGFLTTAEMHQAEYALGEVFAGNYWISERVPVGCDIEPDVAGGEIQALNEIVIGKLVRERLIHLSTYVNGEFIMRYSGDGLIISSATGSTAYSLSSGGPIVTPNLECFILTPICAHMLFSRPMVLDSGDRVTVIVEEKPERLALSIDGRYEVELPPESTVDFFTLEQKVRIVELPDNSFYRTLRSKFLSPPETEER